MHAIGVSTPPAAGVAEATSGLASETHMPNVAMFSSDTSVMTPAGVVADTSASDAVNTAGTAPNVHSTDAPVETWYGTSSSSAGPDGSR